MKCMNCGYELQPDAAFCENCGASVNGSEKTTVIDENDSRYAAAAFERQETPRPYADGYGNSPEPPVPPRYRNDPRPMDPPYYAQPQQAQYNASGQYRYPGQPIPPRYPEPPRGNGAPPIPQKPVKKKKTALIVSIISLILVLAIVGGLIFYFTNYYVSAAEIKEAQDAFLPPAQAFKIDKYADDPSNGLIRFKFNNRKRIISCSYTLKGKQYDQEYIYKDNERSLTIDTMYRGHKIVTKIIEYARVLEPDVFYDVDGYPVRLGTDSFYGQTPTDSPATAAPAPTEAPTQKPTQPPTEPPTQAPTKAPTEAPKPTEPPTEAPKPDNPVFYGDQPYLGSFSGTSTSGKHVIIKIYDDGTCTYSKNGTVSDGTWVRKANNQVDATFEGSYHSPYNPLTITVSDDGNEITVESKNSSWNTDHYTRDY